jgi:serine/threonine protein kinase
MLRGKWKLERLIGVGGMASVYAATHRNGQAAAIKVLHAQFARHTEARTRFLREAYIANKAGAGAVAVQDDDVDDDGSPYLVMELLRGEAVDRRAERLGGTLEVSDVLWIASQTLLTLEHAHDNGIVHRDLKPENLFWTTDGRIKVLDFGIARLREAKDAETTRSGMVLGTPNFMSPEQALGQEDIDARTDLWAVGAIMFRLLSGRDVHPPGANVLVAAATRKAPSLGEVVPSAPVEVVEVVDRALQFERDERYSSAGQMRADVDRCADVDEFDATIPAARISPAKLVAPVSKGKPAPEPAASELAPETQVSPAPPSAAFDGPGDEGGLATGMSDDDSMSLREVLGLIELALRSRAEFGPAHPQTIRNIDHAYRNANEALSRAHIGLFWNVIPEGFVARARELVWRAKPPLVPSYVAMHKGGVRMLGLLPEITPDEFEAVVRLIGGDVSPFEDYATFLQSSHLEHLVYRLEPTEGDAKDPDSISLDPSPGGVNVPAMLDALQKTTDPAMRATLLDRLERWGDGHEARIARVLAEAGVDLAMGLLRVLNTLGSEEARDAMLQATKSKHSVVRVDALSRLQAGHQRLHAEVRELFQGTDAAERLETLVGIEKYRLEVVGPSLALHVRSLLFDSLPLEERRQALSTLGALLPSRAEATAIQMLLDRRVTLQSKNPDVARAAREESRELACECLGKIASTREARDALEASSKGIDRSTDRVRAAAQRALATFDARAAATPRKSEPPARASRPPTRPPPAVRRPSGSGFNLFARPLPNSSLSTPATRPAASSAAATNAPNAPAKPAAPPAAPAAAAPTPAAPAKPADAPRSATHPRLPKMGTPDDDEK